MELFRTIALGLFLFGFMVFSQRVEAFPERSRNEKVQEKLSAAQRAAFFQSTHDSVPEHEVMQFNVRRRRKTESGKPFEVNSVDKAFGDDLKLFLEPADGVLAGKSTPVYLANVNSANGKVIYERVPDAWENVGIPLENRIQQASLVQRTNSKGQLTYDGFSAAHNLVVRSLPESISDSLEEKSSPRDTDSSKDSKTAHHVVYRRQSRNLKYNSKMNANPRLSGWSNTPTFTSPDVIYPEIIVVIDHALFRKFNRNIEETLVYVLAFWNGVDLLYRNFEEPKIRFNIARVIIGVEEGSTPYITDGMYEPELINDEQALLAARNYFYSQFDSSDPHGHDVVMIMTGIRMSNSGQNANSLGIALNSGACSADHWRRDFRSLALVVDNGNFDNVRVAAHEFAHLLSAHHDWDTPCATDGGYIMNPLPDATQDFYNFTVCTERAISNFLRTNGGWCFNNKPVVRDPLPRVLPSSVQDRDDQCDSLGQGPSCYAGEPSQHPCTAVYCYAGPNTASECREIKRHTPADGADCGDGKKCLHGECLEF